MKHIILALSLILPAFSMTAYSEQLNVKPGLWETTTTSEKRAAKLPANMDKLTPEQRAKVEHKLADRVRKETRTVQSCLNEAQIKSGKAFIGKSHQASCTYMFMKQTPSDLDAKLECSGANAMTGRILIHAADPENMSGTVDMTYGAGDNLQLLNRSVITARWLGSDCVKVTVDNRHTNSIMKLKN